MGRVLKADELKSKPLSISKEAREAAMLLVAARRAAYDLRRQAKNDIIDLAIHMAKRIVSKAAELDSSALDELFSTAILSARELEKGVVRVHPADRENSNLDALAADAGFEVVGDSSLERAGCIISAGGMEVDATLSSAIEVFTEAMKGTCFGRS